MHDPEVIILDEPTVGLDPKQIIEVRHLIKGLAGSHTIILVHAHFARSQHDLRSRGDHQQGQDCGGRYSGKSDHAGQGRPDVSHLEVQADENALRAAIQEINGVRKVDIAPTGTSGRLAVSVESAAGQDVRSQIAAKIVGRGWPLFELARREPQPRRHLPAADH